jgi:hypothetical protein
MPRRYDGGISRPRADDRLGAKGISPRPHANPTQAKSEATGGAYDP